VTTALAVEDDPYSLPTPTPQHPVVLPHRIAPGNRHLNSRYSDRSWSLAPLIDNPGATLISINWKNCPAELLEQVKQPAWTMINGELRATYLQTRGMQARARHSATGIAENVYEWMSLARWLRRRGLTDLAACTDVDWRDYVAYRRSLVASRGTVTDILARLTKLWVFDQLASRPAGVTRPPWEIEGVDDFLPAAGNTGGGENSTEPLDPQVIGPLLVWAMRMVDDFAVDILAAWTENRRLTDLADNTPPNTAGKAALTTYLLPLVTAGAPLPTVKINGTSRLARTLIAATTGASLRQVELFNDQHGLTALAALRPGGCPMHVPVTGRIDGKRWREYLSYDEASELMRHLGTAAMIICLYLTGMRPQEVQGLRSGCCPDPEPASDGTTGRHLIRGHHYKNVTDDDGNHISAGEQREVPWVAITPVVHAIRVLERIVPPGELLFSAAHHDLERGHGYLGALKNTGLNRRIADFIKWANREARTHRLPEQTIPDDPAGAVVMSRFRRSLGWHIARRPGGLVALAIQYGHMRTVLDARTSSGYASRSRGGLHSVLDVETALAAADTAAHLRDHIATGAKISGPAARRAFTAAATAPRFEGRIVPHQFARKATDYLTRDGLVLFDNPDALLICVFKHDNALCEPDPDANAPRQYACQQGCGNAIRTDTHARLLRQRAATIDEQSIHTPGPLGNRLQRNAARLRALADTHDATARTAEDLA
jgi:integrase